MERENPTMKAQFTDEDKPVNVIISWSYDLTGEHEDLLEDPITYFFDTNTEADAFLHGVSPVSYTHLTLPTISSV